MVKPTDNIGPLLEYNTIFVQRQDFQIWFFPTWNTLLLNVGGTDVSSTKIDSLQKGKWYFVGFSYSVETNMLHAWVNGVQVNSRLYSGKVDIGSVTDGDIYLGQRKHTKWTWDGAVACVMVYASSLDDSDVNVAEQQCLRTYSKGLFKLDALTTQRRRRYCITITTQRVQCECPD